MRVSRELRAKCEALAEGRPVAPKGRRRRRAAEIVQPTWAVEMTCPLAVVSEPNVRCHWATRHRRFKRQQQEFAGWWHLCGMYTRTVYVVRPRFAVTMTKLGGRKLDDDNLAGAFKAARDYAARQLGVDDGDESVSWHYRQEPGGPVGVRIRIEAKP